VENHAGEQIKAHAILIFDNAMPEQYGSRMGCMTKPGSNGWGIVKRPFPAGLISGSAKRYASNLNDLESAKRKLANFIRALKCFQRGIRHPAKHIGSWRPMRAGDQGRSDFEMTHYRLLLSLPGPTAMSRNDHVMGKNER
jgi:hypothetical protein